MQRTRRHDGWPALAAALCCVVLACGAERSLAASPAVKADQVGYLRTEAKLAMVTSDDATGPFTVRRASDDAVVFTGVLGGARNDAAHSGDTVRWANFSRLRKSGTYYLRVEGAGTSPPFVIADATRFVVGTGGAPFKSSCATADFAAVMAIAARVYKPFDAGFAATCGAAARKAWTWLTAHPNVTYDNNCGIVTGEYGDADCSDERLWAAAELFRTTGRGPYGSYFVANYGVYSPTVRSDWPQDWQNVRNLAMWSYQASPGARPAVRDTIRRDTVAAADAIVERSLSSPYRHSIRPEEYVWGSNGVVANYAVLLLVANDVEADRRYVYTALDNLHYLFGRNTHGVRRWVDETASFASNENAINWNAALVYALASTLPARR